MRRPFHTLSPNEHISRHKEQIVSFIISRLAATFFLSLLAKTLSIVTNWPTPCRRPSGLRFGKLLHARRYKNCPV
ncbi:hypothetical protein BGZ63DRAFT_43972 [Mariannaea sp. PMI_226]|nr:hypothetical protein BGZ63DRAFT_43972 [Mariannaea sp. PMI_226]